MKALGSLQLAIGEKLFGFVAGIVGAKNATRILAATTVSTLYVATVVVFTATIAPWIGSVFTTSYGALLGLLFPPVAGTVIGSLMAYRASVLAYNYTSKLLKMAVG